ncbi:hypothetical protein G7076_01150 [Sphingomonas sp. HDW15A]|uniref:hypothetical protein n=1 Tax=Sphingomonas sp. HDW15A TaxID=2714942 RepID=UPI00140B25D7|nr:hypothetical protein [Sphingomonas sp. HDW15A]QIK95275.1 hypothetical protein G7076_01150 [Sphingomonas sp. HDW15A]
MHKFMLTALGAATIAFASPVAAQDSPLRGGNFWTVAEITIDDGYTGEYADHLAGAYRKNIEFSKSKGWMRNSYILANVNKRAGEPDLYLVTISDHVTTPAEDEAREKELNAFLATTSREQDKQSGARAKYRKLGGSMLLQELLYKR